MNIPNDCTYESEQYQLLSPDYRRVIRSFLYQYLSLGHALCTKTLTVESTYMNQVDDIWTFIMDLLSPSGATMLGSRIKLLGIDQRVVNRPTQYHRTQAKIALDLVYHLINQGAEILDLEGNPRTFIDRLTLLVVPTWSSYDSINGVKLGTTIIEIAYHWIRKILRDTHPQINQALVVVNVKIKDWDSPPPSTISYRSQRRIKSLLNRSSDKTCAYRSLRPRRHS